VGSFSRTKGSKLSLLTSFSLIYYYFPYAPRSNSRFGVGIAIATATFPLLGVLFLKHLLELVRFLAQLHEGLLYGIGLLSAFLSGAEIGFFRFPFLETTVIARIVCRAHAPMLIARSQSFLIRTFWDCGQYQVATYLFYCCAKVSRRKKRRTFWILPGHTYCCTRVSRCKMRWTYWIFPGHIRAR
jgi:hypothetical protein